MLTLLLCDVSLMMIYVCLISSQPTSAGAPEKDQRSGTRTFRSWRLNPNIPTVRRRWYCEWHFAPFLSLFLSILYWSFFSTGSNPWSLILFTLLFFSATFSLISLFSNHPSLLLSPFSSQKCLFSCSVSKQTQWGLYYSTWTSLFRTEKWNVIKQK